MPINKAKKEEILGKLSSVAKTAEAGGTSVFVNFRGLSVSEASAMRKDLRGKGVGYFVAKKTLLRKAFADRPNAKSFGEMPELPGETAVVWADDPLLSAQEAYAFQKSLKGKIAIQGGMFEGKFVGAEFMNALAVIPSRVTLIGQFVNLINSPIQQFVMALDAVAKKREA